MMKKYIDILNRKLENILHDVENEMLDDPTIFEFVQNKHELYKLLLIQTDILTEYLEDFNINKLDKTLYKTFYEELNIPYTVVYKVLNTLKLKLIQILRNQHLDKIEIYEFSNYFQKLLDEIAKIYIKKDSKSLKNVIDSPFKKYLMFNSHIKWLENILYCIENEDLTNFPLTSHQECEFHKVLFYPESLLVCLDKNLCVYLEDLHRMIHKMADSFYTFYKNKQFSEAYFLFKDLKEQILKFKQIISELYFTTYSNVENNFFRLIEMIEYSQDLYLTMIDIKNLKNLNTIYSEQTITTALLEFEKKLSTFINHKESNLLIKGVTSDFYLLNTNISDEEFQNFIKDLKSYIQQLNINVNDFNHNLDALIVSIKIDRFAEFKNFELIKGFSYLKKEAQKQKKDILYIPNASKIINDIINEKINEKFIYKKTNDGDIEVVFQPIYDVKENKIFTLEVLGRIKNNNKLIPAGIFIDKIYEMNLVTKFDMHILDRIIEKKVLIQRVTPRLFINISFQSLLNDKYLNKLEQLFKTFNKTEIILELTEQKFVENYEIIEKINKEHNIFFAVDDFGSGYSSLKTLSTLVKKGVLKVLKIDGSLIKDILIDHYDKKIVKIISQLGQELELLTVAEYIENEEVLKLIDQLNINLAQGFHLSKPKTIEELMLDVN